MTIQELKKKASCLRVAALRAITKAGSGHTGGSMSVMDILVALYYSCRGLYGSVNAVGFRAGEGREEDKDYIILSKGHAAPAQYAILADLGYFPSDELDHLRQVGAMLQGHPCSKIPGITLSTGSLGQGFSAAHGLALSLKLDKRPNKVFVILGDGELQEGIVWETAMSAAQFMSDNLIAIVDNNGLQIDGPCKAVMNVEPIQAKFEAFGWKVIKVVDGNDMGQVLEAIERAKKVTRQPVCIWCRTVKGKGVPFAEGKVEYHGAALSCEELKVAEECLGVRNST
jgi:transketolase